MSSAPSSASANFAIDQRADQRAFHADSFQRASCDGEELRGDVTAVCEEMMLDVMYKLSEQQRTGGKYIITEDVAAGRRGLFEIPPETRKESA